MDNYNGLGNANLSNNGEQPQSQYGQAQNQYGQTQDTAQGINQQYGQNAQGFNQQYQQPNMMDNMAAMGAGVIGMNAPDYMLWLILGIVQICTICCCNCLGCIAGIITVVFTVKANNDYKAGNGMGYAQNIKVAKIVCCVGFGLMILGWVGSFITGLYSALLDMLNL